MSKHESSSQVPKIVILGAGFGGIYTFLSLRRQISPKKAEITIVNNTNHFLFTPLLHEVATGGLAHHQVVEAVRMIAHKRGANVHLGDVERIDTQKGEVKTTTDVIPYDYLVIATGASAEFHATPGAKENAFVLKTLKDAIKVRNRFIDAFEKALQVQNSEERQKLLTFVVVGGGASGVELAAEMAELFHDTLQKFFSGKILRGEPKIYLIAREKELIVNFHEKMRERADEILKRVGVEIKYETGVTAVDANGVTLTNGEKINSSHVLWMAGVKPNVPESDVPFSLNRGRIVVDKHLRVKSVVDAGGGAKTKSVYALGDVATFETECIPMHAQAAVQEAPTVAINIISEIKRGKPKCEFKYQPMGDLVSLGQWQAAGYFLKRTWTGPVAWFVWRTVYLFKFASWSKRVKIALDWIIDAFYPRDITRA